jgi:hypothetical protein
MSSIPSLSLSLGLVSFGYTFGRISPGNILSNILLSSLNTLFKETNNRKALYVAENDK